MSAGKKREINVEAIRPLECSYISTSAILPSNLPEFHLINELLPTSSRQSPLRIPVKLKLDSLGRRIDQIDKYERMERIVTDARVAMEEIALCRNCLAGIRDEKSLQTKEGKKLVSLHTRMMKEEVERLGRYNKALQSPPKAAPSSGWDSKVASLRNDIAALQREVLTLDRANGQLDDAIIKEEASIKSLVTLSEGLCEGEDYAAQEEVVRDTLTALQTCLQEIHCLQSLPTLCPLFDTLSNSTINGRRLGCSPLPLLQYHWAQINGSLSSLCLYLQCLRNRHGLGMRCDLARCRAVCGLVRALAGVGISGDPANPSHPNPSPSSGSGASNSSGNSLSIHIVPLCDRALLSISPASITTIILEGGVMGRDLAYSQAIVYLSLAVGITSLEILTKQRYGGNRKKVTQTELCSDLVSSLTTPSTLPLLLDITLAAVLYGIAGITLPLHLSSSSHSGGISAMLTSLSPSDPITSTATSNTNSKAMVKRVLALQQSVHNYSLTTTALSSQVDDGNSSLASPTRGVGRPQPQHILESLLSICRGLLHNLSL